MTTAASHRHHSVGTVAQLRETAPSEDDSRPTVAPWILSGVSVLGCVGFFVLARADLLRLWIPLSLTLVAASLVIVRPITYLHLALWTWFLAPLVRRLIDWHFGFVDENIVLITPLLVSAAAVLTPLRHRWGSKRSDLRPFILCGGGILYGAVVGVIRTAAGQPGAASIGEVAYGLLNWGGPLLVGLHLYLREDVADRNRLAVRQSMMLALVLLGAYGIFQYVYAPPWDAYWQSEIKASTFGGSGPFEMRIWSTATAPLILAVILATGLVLIAPSAGRWKWLAMGLGYPAFLLTLIRTAWLGWLFSLLLLCRGSSRTRIVNLFASLSLLPILVSPLLLVPEVAGVVQARFTSLTNITDDGSFLDRKELYSAIIPEAARQTFGLGLRNSLGYDSGVLQAWLTLGPLGFALFLFGVLSILRNPRQGPADEEKNAFYAATIGLFLQNLSAPLCVGTGGALLWVMLALIHSQPKAPSNMMPASTPQRQR